MVPRETGRRRFIAGAIGLHWAGDPGRAGPAGFSVPGLDTGHSVAWTVERDRDAAVYPVAVAGSTAVATVKRPNRDDDRTFEVDGLALADGKRRWHQQLDGWPSIPTAVGDTAVLQTADRAVGFDARDGSERWTFEGRTYRSGFLPVADGTVYLTAIETGNGQHNAVVNAVDATTGDRVWRTDPDGIRGTPLATLAAGGLVVLGDEAGVTALDAADGSRRWRTEIGDRRFRPVERRNDRVYAWAREEFVALDAATGETLWRQPRTPGELYGYHGAVTDATAFVHGDGLAAVNAATGAVRWRFRPDGTSGNEAAVSTAVRRGTVYASVGRGLYALDAATGDRQWSFEGDVALGPYATSVTDGVVYLRDSGAVVALDANDGTERWRYDVDGSVYWLDTAGNLLFVGTDRGVVHAIDRPSPLATAPVATAERFATSPPGLGLLGLVGAGLLGAGYRRRAAGDATDSEPAFGRLDRLGGGPVTETYRKRVRTPAGPRVVAETRLVDAADGGLRRAFARAVERWADLDVRGVVPVREYAVGSDADPPRFETPYLPGGSLADAWPVDYRTRVEGASGVARTLHAAHREGVVHGRLAPRHVFPGVADAGSDGADGVDGIDSVGEVAVDPRVGGWFLADALADARGARDPYAPPESESGESGDAAVESNSDPEGVAGDVYRAGALARHLLAGAVPGADAEPRDVTDCVGDELADVLARALAADPGDRYESALAFDDALRWAALDR